MIVNSTCLSGNDTVACVVPGSSAGLAVGLTLLFLMLLIVAGFIVYKYHSAIRNMLQFESRRSQNMEGYTETPHGESQPYTSMTRQSREQNPIYENLTTQTTEHERRAAKESRSSIEPEEDVYLQCDSQDDAIYSNDPACNLSIVSDYQEDDVYIVPES